MTTATLITVALLVPFWWGLGLFALALIGDLWPSMRRRVSRVFERLEGTPREVPAPATVPERYAA